MWDWYYTSPPNKTQMPFQDLDSHLISNAAKRLQNMWVNILQLQNKDLYDHLVANHVLPTTFGINWTKLLFTRQFADYFHLWDAIIVSKFTLVDYIVVAMVKYFLFIFSIK